MHLVIVESPAKAKTINKYLGKDYNVLASFGHVRDLPSKDGSVEPENDFAMHYEVSSDSKKHVAAIKSAIKGCDTLYLATDPDREGEAISWHVLEALRNSRALPKKTEVKRVIFNEITKRAVLAGVANPRDIDMDLVNAQQARRALDYLVGFTLSPILWRKLPGSKSAGRVQSVALRLVCDREAEIEAFKKQEYWDIHADLLNSKKNAFRARLTHWQGDKLEKLTITNEETATGIVKALKAKAWQVGKITSKQVKRNPFAPFTTSTLQQEASLKLRFSAKQTMQVAQKLYEGIDIGGETTGLITYMRTDGVTVAPEAISQARKHIETAYGNAYLPEKPRHYSAKAKNAQEAHEAIRPTNILLTPEQTARFLNKEQQALYTLIWKRMVASQMEPARLDQVAAEIVSADKEATLRANGSTIAFDGFYKLYRESRDDEKEEKENLLPPLEEGEAITAKDITTAQHFTEPPARYSEASLVKKLEELGIGRPSTYAAILSVLQDRGYVVLDKRRFIPEARGRLVTTFLTAFFARYLEYDFTAQLEGQLDTISAGDVDWKQVLAEFWNHFSTRSGEVMEIQPSEVTQKLEELLAAYVFPEREDGSNPHICPTCKEGELHLKAGKFGAFVGCSSYPECRYTRPLFGNEGEDDANTPDDLPRLLGTDPANGKEVHLKKGPYGLYVERPEDEGKPKRASIAKGKDPETVTLEYALRLLSLPREVGKHPETGKVIEANFGRFGPFIKHESTYANLSDPEDVFTIGINHAVTLLAEKAQKSGKAEPLKKLGEHPDGGGEVNVFEGRYGPYVKFKKTNATLPKDLDPQDVTLEQAVELIAAKQAAPKKKKSSGRKKKSA